ncbi:MAG: Phosphoglycerate mutase [Gemmatimonadetes bacterium]|nr:Phosphoglycerate mutase [Gemmatimonadota bacterium]
MRHSLRALLLPFMVATLGCHASMTMGRAKPADDAAVTTVILVRHAEKASASAADPVLSEAGMARARALDAALRDERIDAVIVTQFQRTRLTAAPLSERLALTPQVIVNNGTAAEHVKIVADAVRAHAGEVVLVVGHSNTVPAIIGALGGPALGPLCEPEFDHLYILTLAAGKPARLVQASYGAADPADAANCRAGKM